MSEQTASISFAAKLKTIYGRYAHLPVEVICSIQKQMESASYRNDDEIFEHAERLLASADRMNQFIARVKGLTPSVGLVAAKLQQEEEQRESADQALADLEKILRETTQPEVFPTVETEKEKEPTNEVTGEAVSVVTRSEPKAHDEYIDTVSEFLLSSSYEDALSQIESVVVEFRRSGEYELIRSRYLQLSVELNLYKCLAPSARPDPGMGSGKPLGHPFHHALQRDQVVIDLHWAHATQQEGIEVCPGFERYGDLLDPKQDFCFDTAWELAAKNLTNDFRVLGVFVISDFLQFQMAKLRSQQTRAKVLSYSKRRSMPDGTRQPAVDKLLAQQLMDWLRRDSRIKNEVSCYKGIGRARFLLGSTCTNKMLAKLAALLAGVPERAPKTIAEKLQKLQAHTDPSMWV